MIRALIFYLVIAWPFHAAAQTAEPTVLVRLTLDAGYDDTPEKLAALADALDQARVREVPAESGDTPNSVIARELGFGKTNRPRSYQLVDAAVRRLNPTFAKQAAAGKVLIPDIGAWALSDYNVNKPANYVPKIQRWERTQVELRGADVIFRGDPKITDSGRTASQSVANEYPVPASVAEEWKKDPGFDGEVLNFPLEAHLANADEVLEADLRLLDDAGRQEVREILSHSRHDSLLVVADTGWPSKTAYEDSLRTLTKILNTVRRVHLKLETPISLPTTSFTPPQNGHCRQIARALEEFEALDTLDRVKTIYLPLTREQDATTLVREMLVFEYLLGIMKKAPSKIRPTPEDQATAARQMDIVVQQLPAFWDKDQQRVRTDKALLQAYLVVLNLYTAAEGVDATFFFNTSWTTPPGEYFLAFPSPIRGAIVAAAGNDGQNFVANNLEFARRTLGQRDTIAVLNMDTNGPAGNTSLLAEADVKRALAVGFDGRLNPSGVETGTSFSAPRVAWLFAAAEGVRPKRFDLRQWGFDAMDLLTELRGPNPGLKSIRIDPVSFLRRAATP
jgi:hypothetical protein